MTDTFTFSNVHLIELIAAPVPAHRIVFARARFSRGAVHPIRN